MREKEYFVEGKCCIKKCNNEVFQTKENLCRDHWKPWFNWKVEYTARDKKPLREEKEKTNEKGSDVLSELVQSVQASETSIPETK